jgi:hypothetical protein
VNQVVAGLVGQGLSIYDSLRHAIPKTAGTEADGTPER